MHNINGDGWSGELGGMAPVQAEGLVDGNPFYFRARHETWSFTVSEPNTDPIDAFVVDDHILYHREEPYGDHEFAASYMPTIEAIGAIEDSIRLFREGGSHERTTARGSDPHRTRS